MTARRAVPATTFQLRTAVGARREPTPRSAPHDVNDPTVRGDTRLLLTVQEAAERLGIGRSLMYELIASGRVSSVRVGRLRRISPPRHSGCTSPSCTPVEVSRQVRPRSEFSCKAMAPVPQPDTCLLSEPQRLSSDEGVTRRSIGLETGQSDSPAKLPG